MVNVLDRTGAPNTLRFMAAQYVADVHNICLDPALPDKMTLLQYQLGITPDISAYLQFTFWQPVLYLDHESEWPASKERSARWIGVAHGIGDALTFWVLDDQAKQILARSVFEPNKHNLRVKWDPQLEQASNPGEDKIGLIAADKDRDGKEVLVIEERTDIPTAHDDVNPGIDTSKLHIPTASVITRSR